jgi:uncharacterized protein
MRASRVRRTATLVALTGAAVLAAAVPASAHVTVSSDDTTRGAGDAILTFRVPNELDTATTSSVTLTFPTANPLASVKPAPKTGWTVTTVPVTFPTPITTDDGTITTGVGSVTYTAAPPNKGIPLNEFDTFQVLVGPLPDVASLAFPVVQTYSDGNKVSWIQPTIAGQPAPDHPAPVLALTTAGAGGGGAGGGGSAAAGVSAAPLSGYAKKSSADDAKKLAIVGVALGALGLVVGAAGFVVRRRR